MTEQDRVQAVAELLRDEQFRQQQLSRLKMPAE